MPDNKNMQDQRDRRKIARKQHYEIAYLEKKLGVSKTELKSAFVAVGNDRKKVEGYFNNTKSRK